MAHRLPEGGALIDRDRPVRFTWNGRRMAGLAGDTLASALLANGTTLMGRSFKYHRPRGVVAAGVEEPNALVALGRGNRMEPNQRATTAELFPGLTARSQNHWPSLELDVGAVNARLAALLPAGFYYKTFIHPRAAWKHLFEPVIRQSAGLGPAPSVRAVDPDRYEYLYHHTDVLVAGGGVAGLAAAEAAAAGGARVLLVEQSPHWGGRALADARAEDRIGGMVPAAWVAATLARLRAMPNVTCLARTTLSGVFDHGYALALERLQDHAPGQDGPRQRLWRIRAGRIVTAAGAIERPLTFAGNDRPGVMLASAIRDYLTLWGVAVGRRVVIATTGEDGHRTALALHAAGIEVPAILDTRTDPAGPLSAAAAEAGLRILPGAGPVETTGGKTLRAVTVAGLDGRGQRQIACDALGMAGGWSPTVHLWSQAGGKLAWDAERAAFLPDPTRPPIGADGTAFVLPAGATEGAFALGPAANSGAAAGARAAAEALGKPARTPAPIAATAPEDTPEAGANRPVWILPEGAPKKLRAKAFVDFQNDVKASDIALAAQEGFESVEHTKRYTTLGMATDQGKLSNIPGLALLSESLGADIPAVGTTTFRPPYTPVTLGALAGEARGPLFKPTRKTAMDAWHAQNGARWEPVGDWRRPYCYRRPGESIAAAVRREILGVRGAVGLLDASTLGKILVTGPDAGTFLDRIYTNMMSSLKPGRCRYGLMCNENGFLFDDGVVARLSEESFLCHTTSGGSDHVHAWLEEWLQTEWWDLRVYTANLTEQYAQIAVVGPEARRVLERLGGTGLSAEALSFMGWTETTLAGIGARVFRISFSGELSFEVAVPASHGLALWDALLEAGRDLDVMPYGTEALHVMRAEKGYIMIGDETDGTVTPQDLGLSWAVSKKKADFLGKRAQARPHLTAPDRKQLVGLLTEDPKLVLPTGAQALGGRLQADGQAPTIGHVTSSYMSPTLGHSIAMALIERGRERMGETVEIGLDGRRTATARLVDPVFYDPEGSRQNV